MMMRFSLDLAAMLSVDACAHLSAGRGWWEDGTRGVTARIRPRKGSRGRGCWARSLMPTDCVTVARVGDISSGHGCQVTVENRRVALFNLDGAFHAIDNICLHRGGPLAEGSVAAGVVTCPWHGWQYDIATGTMIQDPRVGVTRHETRVVGGEIQVRLAD